MKEQKTKNKDQKKRYKNDIVVLAQKFSISCHTFLKQLKRTFSSKHIILQCFRSSSSITANIIEAQSNSSRRNLAFKYSISLKEARETYYWLTMLIVEFPNKRFEIEELKKQLSEIIAIVTSITKKLSNNGIKIILFFIFSSLFFFNVSSAHAAITLNEVYPQPQTDELEWVELYNSATESADLSEWSLEDQLSSPSIIHSFVDEVIDALSYLVIELPTSKLNNSADGVTLRDGDGRVIDEMSYQNSELEKSWAKLDTGGWILDTSSKGIANPQPTATPNPTANPTPQPTPAPTPTNIQYPISDIYLSEIMACPQSGETEWIEIYSSNDDEIDLSNWYILDSDEHKKVLDSYLIPHNSYLVVEWSSGFLNNSGDSISLFTPNDTEVFSASFGECVAKGDSFIEQAGSWQETSTVTKGGANQYTALPTDDEKDPAQQSEQDDPSFAKASQGRQNENDSTAEPLPLNPIPYSYPSFHPEGLVLGVATAEAEMADSTTQALTPESGQKKTVLSILAGGFLTSGSSVWMLLRRFGL